jgi:cytosine/adenosine deaminase-related metal-dependent hydrolase
MEEILKWGTLNGANFLGLYAKYGSFTKGKKPRIIHLKDVNSFTCKINSNNKKAIV